MAGPALVDSKSARLIFAKGPLYLSPRQLASASLHLSMATSAS
jgi:hypothetical protein